MNRSADILLARRYYVSPFARFLFTRFVTSFIFYFVFNCKDRTLHLGRPYRLPRLVPDAIADRLISGGGTHVCRFLGLPRPIFKKRYRADQLTRKCTYGRRKIRRLTVPRSVASVRCWEAAAARNSFTDGQTGRRKAFVSIRIVFSWSGFYPINPSHGRITRAGSLDFSTAVGRWRRAFSICGVRLLIVGRCVLIIINRACLQSNSG